MGNTGSTSIVKSCHDFSGALPEQNCRADEAGKGYALVLRPVSHTMAAALVDPMASSSAISSPAREGGDRLQRNEAIARKQSD